MLAVAKLMNFKGHMGMAPCQVCRMVGCQCEASGRRGPSHYYFPHTAPDDWDGKPEFCDLRGRDYTTRSLPLRNHKLYLDNLDLIAKARQQELAKTVLGINALRKKIPWFFWVFP